MAHVIAHGNPFDGLGLLGPFKEACEAIEQASMRFDEYWVLGVDAPAGAAHCESGSSFLMHGNPIDGLAVIGPFADCQSAGDFAVTEGFEYWWSVDAQVLTPDASPAP